MSKPRMAIVFDGVLHNGAMEIASVGIVSGEPIAGARAFLSQVTQSFEVLIISPRFSTDLGLHAAIAWSHEHFGTLTDQVTFEPGFPEVAFVLSADVVHFAGSFPSLPWLRTFRRWSPHE